MADESGQISWSQWLKQARYEAKFYGIGRISMDVWREQFAVGNSPSRAVEQVMLRRGLLE